LDVNLLNWLLAFSPILVVLILLLGLRWGGAQAGTAGAVVAILVAAMFFGAGPRLLLLAELKGLLLTLFVLYIIWMALLFYHVTDEAGAVASIGVELPRLTAIPAMQVLLLGWVFSSFLQGAGGFGVPVAVVAPLLVGLGFTPLAAVVIPSLGHAWAVTFGSLGSSFYALMAATGLSGEVLAPWSATMMGLTCLLCGAAVLFAADGRCALRQGTLPMLVVGTGMALVQYVVVVNGFWELGGLSGGLAGLALFVLVLRLPRYQGHANPAVRGASREHPPLLIAMVPYALLILVIIAGQLIPRVEAFLGQVVVRAEFPELEARLGWVTPAETGRTINAFGHAGALLFYAAMLSFLFLRWRGYYKPSALRRVARNTVKRATRSSIGIATMVGMAVAMEHAGMTRVLAEGVAGVVGGAFPLASPFIGALGAFMTGSNTNSNVVFGPFQQDAANLLGVNALIILAAQTAGGALGSMFAPAKVIVGASTVGLGGEEGPVMRQVMGYGLVLVAIIALATWAVIRWGG
jgi:lactate permease